MGNRNKGQADNITKYYDYVAQRCKPGDLIFVRKMKKIDNYGKVARDLFLGKLQLC